MRFKAEIKQIHDRLRNEETEEFFEKTLEQLENWFADGYIVQAYEKYYRDNPYVENYDLYDWINKNLEELE